MKVIQNLHLTQLSINCETNYNKFDFTSNEMLEKIAKMQTLSKLRLRYHKESDTGICDLIKNSPKLKTIELNDKHINDITIEAFVEKALNDPKTYYKFIAQNSPHRKRVTINTILKNLFIEKLL
jgi:hypothetical protein